MRKMILLALIISISVSCKKSKDDAQACISDMASISGSYKITACTYKGGPQFPEIDYLHSLFDACELDDIYKFSANESYQIMDIGVVCFPSGDETGTWKLQSGTAMIIDGDPVILESFDCKTLVIVNTDTQQPGDRLKLTLTRQ